MLFYLDDHALHVSLNLFLVMVTGGTTAEDYDGGCHRTPAASDERGSVPAGGAGRRTRWRWEEGQPERCEVRAGGGEHGAGWLRGVQF